MCVHAKNNNLFGFWWPFFIVLHDLVMFMYYVCPVKMLVQVKFGQLQKYVKLDCIEGRFDFMQFHEKGLYNLHLTCIYATP